MRVGRLAASGTDMPVGGASGKPPAAGWHPAVARHGELAGCLVGLLVVAAYALMFPGLLAGLVYALASWVGVGATLLGIHLHRPARRRPWVLLAACLSMSGLAGVVSAIGETTGAQTAVFSVPLNLAAFALAAAAVASTSSTVGAGRRRRGAVLDTLTIATGLGLLIWTFLLMPALQASALSGFDRAAAVAYCLAAVLVLALLLSLATTPGLRGPAFVVLVAGAMVCLLSTLLGQVVRLSGTSTALPAHLLLLGCLALVDLAVLHPSMRELSDHSPGGEPDATPGTARLALLALAMLLAPGSLAVQLATGRPVEGWAIVIGSALMSLLVLARLADLLGRVQEQARQLAAQADTDALTGLANRRTWDREMYRSTRRADRHDSPLAVVVLDLDNFKIFNDTHGHPAGDDALRRAASAWRSCLRADDVLARLGGEEFAVQLTDTRPETAVGVAEKLRRAAPCGLTVSVGVAYRCPGEDAASLLARADVALYAAKRRGRDRVELAECPARRELAG